ncbi:hypothetical protein TH53_04455 [Pedobacter lusitanus]|uniref:Thiol-activated cytolysin n=1 Tax=Pedobacter lusitanus TaxID=1503925 RepID=A0A0D0F955_9SPHI|nr:thiol-activated cytolysin family protein [Pedobacter lusitanus]KIO78273.1 hypothetical protein TH53_04455 [Pedobacter lusitanus]
MKTSTCLYLLLIIVLTGCSKADNPGIGNKYSDLKPAEGGNIKISGANISTFSEAASSSQSNTKKISSIGIMSGPNDRPHTIAALHLNPADMWLGDQAGMTFTGYTDEFIMLPEWLGQQDNFYLGSLIKGNSIASVEMNPLSERLGDYESKPISASISLPLKTVTGMYNPTELRTSEFYSKLLTANGMQNGQKAAFSYDIQEFTYYDELKTVFGSNAKVGALFFGSNTTTTNGTMKISKTTGLVAKFTQKNFSLDMDAPAKGELYNNLNLTALGGYWPAYISTITYGSTGILVVESNDDQEVVNSTYKKAFSILGGLVSGGSNLTEAEQGTINRSSMKIYFIGPNGAEAIKSIFTIEELTNYIKKGSTFSAQSPGVPISFKMKSLPDNKPLISNFKIDLPVDMIYVKYRKNQVGDENSGFGVEMYVDSFADAKCKIPIITPERISFYFSSKPECESPFGCPSITTAVRGVRQGTTRFIDKYQIKYLEMASQVRLINSPKNEYTPIW